MQWGVRDMPSTRRLQGGRITVYREPEGSTNLQTQGFEAVAGRSVASERKNPRSSRKCTPVQPRYAKFFARHRLPHSSPPEHRLRCRGEQYPHPPPQRWALVPPPTPKPAFSVFTRDLAASVVETAQNSPPGTTSRNSIKSLGN